MISQKTVLTLSQFYAAVFGVKIDNYSAKGIQNTVFAEFLYKNGFADSWRKEALKTIYPNSVKELILDIYSEKFFITLAAFYQDKTLGKTDKSRVLLILAKLILVRFDGCKSLSKDYVPICTELVLNLRNDGYYYYESEIYIKDELMEKCGVYYDSVSDKFVFKTEMAIPTVKDLLLELPLYEQLIFNDEVLKHVISNLHIFREPIDAYCVECELSSTFHHSNYSNSINGGKFSVILKCSRISIHEISFYFIAGYKSLVKIGQFPSIADLTTTDVKKYRKVLDKKYPEFTKAIGLASHGIGVGSFVYLRRIFEYLIEKAHQTALQNPSWRDENETVFNENQKRVVEKIQLLKDYLPEFLVVNRAMYGIISKGIHELTEDECLRYFPIIKNSIELILDQEIERRTKITKEQEVQREIQKIQDELAAKEQ